VVEIELDDIEISERKGRLRIIAGKGGNDRDIHLNKTVRYAIREYLQVRPTLPETNKLFISQLNRPLSKRSIYHLTKKYLAAAGMPDLSCHSLRHLFATNLYNRHKDILLVKEALGHKTLESTLRYSHKSEEDIAKAMENSHLNIYKDSS
jgi:integrase/recombinase XerC/integrase/recombinase XerD